MKILFAVSNENISEAVKKEYQNIYKMQQVVSKNVYYFNAVIKELQNNKTYDIAIISEDLEPFANNNYDTIDKFLIEKLSSIREEAKKADGTSMPIILITTDRHVPGDFLVKKLYEIGIYNALVGADRNVHIVCDLIDHPRGQNEARSYYNVQAATQQAGDSDVSEEEIQNIIAYYKKLGKDEEKYVEGFDNIASQYTDGQLKVIIKFLPLNVKAVLEAKSPKYQQLMTFANNYKSNTSSLGLTSVQNEPKIKEKDLKVDSSNDRIMEQISSTQVASNIIIPNNVDINSAKKIEELEPKQSYVPPVHDAFTALEEDVVNTLPGFEEDAQTAEEEVTNTLPGFEEDETDVGVGTQNDSNANVGVDAIIDPMKKGRGRPKKPVDINTTATPKKGRGRPKKIEPNTIEDDSIASLPGMEDDYYTNTQPAVNPYASLTANSQQVANKAVSPVTSSQSEANAYTQPVTSSQPEANAYTQPVTSSQPEANAYTQPVTSSQPEVNAYTQPVASSQPVANTYAQPVTGNQLTANSYAQSATSGQSETEYKNIEQLISRDKKVASFVGTSKSGTSFIVNNIAQLLSSMNINVAILDMTQNRNSFYIYTNNNESLRSKVSNTMIGLRNGTADGIVVNKNLTVYTAIPNETEVIYEADKVIETLVQSHSVVLIDCDYKTPVGYFDNSQNICLVQNMDILTMQPLTTFVKELKSKNVLKEEKLKVIINMATNVKGINERVLVGAISVYKDPGMAYMLDLFNKDTVQSYSIPFDIDAYSKYLESLISCDMSLNGYSKSIINSLKQIANVLYPMANTGGNKKGYAPPSLNNSYSQPVFGNNINNTLDQMKNKY
ncbi:MAG: hypothetical protein FWF46_01335 [Oscillospiraceae bacterium]|nr:hypothetical protein [Oscillospiraceae bacterium]